MNGRIYDPELGRFLSPDPIVQIPEYSQNFNRYSYVLNNPLNATDPSGFSFISKAFSKIGSFIKENWRTLAVIVVVAFLALNPYGIAFINGLTSAVAPGLVGASWTVAGVAISGAQIAAGVAIGAIAGGLSSALNGGDIGDVLRGAAIGGIQGGITGGILNGMEGAASSFTDKALHVAGHGIVGGASNAAMGGKFQDGFLSAAAGSYAGWTFLKNTTIANSIGSSGFGRTAIASTMGGTASALGGGKFANGAYTAAFQHLLNNEFPNALRALRIHHMELARMHLGVEEYSEGWNPNIKEYQFSTGVKGEYWIDDGVVSANKENAWCGAFVHWVLKSVGAPTLDYGNDKYKALQQNLWVNFGSGSFPSV
jgi:hypothetical protein